MNWVSNWFGKTHPTIIPSEIENVCFKGGGVKGNAFLGVDKAFTELGMWPQIKRFIGSSAGAIFAGAAACRIPYADMKDVIDNTNFTKFEDTSWGLIGEGIRLVEDWGLYQGEYFFQWYRNILDQYVGNPDITFQEVYDQFGSELVITTTDLTKRKLVYMSRKTDPELSIAEAVRRSMSIPVYFVPVKYTDSDNLVHVLVDGGCTNNFPLDFFDQLYSTPEEAFTKTVGFNLESSDCDDPKKYQDQTFEINSLTDLMTSLINTSVDVIERTRLRDVDKYRVIEINTGTCQATDFDITREEIQKLADAGYHATLNFFQS